MSATAEHARMAAFESMTREEQIAAIRRLAQSGYTDHGISHATGLSVEQCRVIIGDRTTRR